MQSQSNQIIEFVSVVHITIEIDMNKNNFLVNLFDEKRVLICILACWTVISSAVFGYILLKDESTFLMCGPNNHNKLFGVPLDNWHKWSAVALYTFIATCIASFSGDAIFPFVSNVIMDPKTKYIPYSKFTCLMIIQTFTIYEVCFHVIGTFVALTQIDFTLIRITADLLINYYTTGWFLRGKTVDKNKYDEWKKENDDSNNVSNEMNEIKTDRKSGAEKENEQDDSIHDKFAVQSNEKENELLLTQ